MILSRSVLWCAIAVPLSWQGSASAVPAQTPPKAGTTRAVDPAKNADAAKKADVAFRAGLAAHQQGQIEQAREQFAEVVRLEPAIPEAREALGAVLLELGRSAEAVPQLEAAAKLQPNDAGIENNLALAYAASGEPAKAIPHFEAVLRLAERPGQSQPDATVYDGYARALAAAGNSELALEQFKREEQLAGQRPDIEDDIGTLYAQLGRWAEAHTAFDNAIAADASFSPAYTHLGILLRQRGDLAGSAKTLEAATRLEPVDPLALLEFARTLVAEGQDEAAEPVFERALKLNADLPAGATDLAMALQRLGRQQEAIPWFRKALVAEPRNPRLLANLVLALTLKGNAK